MRYKKEDIYNKGFDIAAARSEEPAAPLDFAGLRAGIRALTDANLDLGVFKKTNSSYGDKAFVVKALSKRDSATVSEISEFYYETSGIYNRMCKYLAQLFRYDWFITPYIIKEDNLKEDKLLADFAKVLDYLDDSEIKILFGNIALEVVKTGAYYGCVVDYGAHFALQQLPKAYCRSRYNLGAQPMIELNLKFFDTYFTDITQRIKILKMFPKDVQKAYIMYKEGKLPAEFPGDTAGWCLLDPANTVKFSIGGEDIPPLAGVIPSIIDLDSAQELDRKKTMQQLLKIIIQKLPRDKNGDLIFDVEEARDMHNSAVNMLRRAVGVDVLTTFADIDVADMDGSATANATDALERVERTVYNNAGISQNIFNAEGNVAIANAILNDEATMRELVYQFQAFLNRILNKFNSKKYEFKATMLETTIYNYKDLAKTYKEQTQMGYSKMLPQIALGHSQSMILASLHFENSYLHLEDLMIPPLTSNVMNADTLEQFRGGSDEKETGRPEKADAEKSDKTIANQESLG